MKLSHIWSLGIIVFLLGGCAPKTHQNQQVIIDSLVQKMTLHEKIDMIHASSSFTSGGVERLQIPELVMSDGPHSVRHEHGRDWIVDDSVDYKSTYLPTGIALASTWNPELGYKFGSTLGSEANARGKDIILGPGINIIRTPLNGRNFEYMSEDPYLISKMVVGYIKGVQDQGIAACVKHYIANNQERDRFTINVEISDRALHEIYLPGFKAAIQDGEVLTLMSAYNKFRDVYCSHSEFLLKDILRKEFGFKGIVISDWNAVHNTIDPAMNGLDIEMGTDLGIGPHYNRFYMADTLESLVENGAVPESAIDEKVRNILGVMEKINKFGKRIPGEINTKQHQEVALNVAREALVLLKNENEILPVKQENIKSIAVIGYNATLKHAELGGSSQSPALYEITPLEGIKSMVNDNVTVTYSQGYYIDSVSSYKPDMKLLEEAVKTAKSADLVIYVGGWFHGYSKAWKHNAFDAEDADKPSMVLPFGQNELIDALLKANSNTVTVFMGGGPFEMPWINNAKGIIQAWYPGMEGGTAIAEVIFGKTNPSGKLPVTFPKKLADSPAHALGEYPGNNGVEHYNEDIFVGYRYFDSYNVEPLFPFGHGLSYTTFDYSDMETMPSDSGIFVKINIKNSGKTEGSEVAQFYVSDKECSVKRPEKELKAFEKIRLAPGESKTIEAFISKESLQFYNETMNGWDFENGSFTIMAGSSSRDIKAQKAVDL